MKVSFKGILQAHVEDLSVLPEIAPKGFIYLGEEDLHITLLNSKELGEYKEQFKRDWKNHQDLFPLFPEISFEAEPYIARNEGKCSWVLDLDKWSQFVVWYWLHKVLKIMGLHKVVQPSDRVFHVSLANTTGSRFDSVPDPWNHRQ